VKAVALAALLIGIVAAALDFSSGYALAGGGDGVMVGGEPFAFAVSLLVLGVAALTAGAVAVLPQMGNKMKQVGLAMEICGVAMAAVSAWAPIMAPLMDFAMLAVGGLMVLNGALMQRKTPMTPRV
jgi:hypothetical protein